MNVQFIIAGKLRYENEIFLLIVIDSHIRIEVLLCAHYIKKKNLLKKKASVVKIARIFPPMRAQESSMGY